MAWHDKQVLVAGGAGFIGSHLCDDLLEHGHHVLCVDNLRTGVQANIDHLRGHPRFDTSLQDVVVPFEAEVSAVFNLACPAGQLYHHAHRVQTTKTAVLGTINLLELAHRKGARLVQGSTSAIYGSALEHPQAEASCGRVDPVGPRACYDEAQRCAETLCFDYHREHGVSVGVARVFNVFGPRMLGEDGGVVGRFIVQALRGEPLTVYGDGQHTRSFCYVDDVVDGLVALMDAPDGDVGDVEGDGNDDAQPQIGPVNLGNPAEMRIIDLAALVIDLTGSPSSVVFEDLPSDDPGRRRPDITRARQVLGWSPVVPIRAGLERTIGYFDDQLTAGRSALFAGA